MADKKVTAGAVTDAGPSELPNRPGEPLLKLALTINKVVFKCADDRKPISVIVKIFNPTNDVVSYKVRCTSAEIFRVQVPVGSLKPQGTIDVTLWYHNAQKLETLSKNHYFAFYHTKVVDPKQLLKDLWVVAKPDGVRRLPVVFEAK